MGSGAEELIRKRYLYRRMILSGQVSLSAHGVVRLIGPDCAYHLYGQPGRKGRVARKRKA